MHWPWASFSSAQRALARVARTGGGEEGGVPAISSGPALCLAGGPSLPAPRSVFLPKRPWLFLTLENRTDETKAPAAASIFAAARGLRCPDCTRSHGRDPGLPLLCPEHRLGPPGVQGDRLGSIWWNKGRSETAALSPMGGGVSAASSGHGFESQLPPLRLGERRLEVGKEVFAPVLLLTGTEI